MVKKISFSTDMGQTYVDPFSEHLIGNLLQVSSSNPCRLISRENSMLEFKQSFNWGNKEEYARTAAAYANCRGGYIVFGVKNKPHDVVGIDINKFNSIDPAIISEFFNQAFSVELEWDVRQIEIVGNIVLLMFIYPSKTKPVIATRNNGKIADGDIFYRYRGRTQKIRHPELQQILEERRKRDEQAWIQLLGQISVAGIDSIAVVNLLTGQGSATGSSFLIDETSLQKLKFIKEGHFVERGGSPTLRIVGDADVVKKGLIQPVKLVDVPKTVRTPEIIRAFLNKEIVKNPVSYVEQICFEVSAFLPVYYFADLAKLGRHEIINIVNGVLSTTNSRKKLLERLEANEDLYISPPKKAATTGSKFRSYYINAYKNKSVGVDINISEVKWAIMAIRSLRKDEIDFDYLAKLLLVWFDRYYVDEMAGAADDLRRAICYLDVTFYRE